jgi:hypothetical protein
LQDDPRYNNDDEIIPYSNWRGPMWVNANAITCYGLMRYGFDALAMKIATRVTATLADDLRNTTQWHEAYSTADGASERTFSSFFCLRFAIRLSHAAKHDRLSRQARDKLSGNMTQKAFLLSVVR